MLTADPATSRCNERSMGTGPGPVRIGSIRRALPASAALALILCAFGLITANAQASLLADYPDFSSVAGLQLNGAAAQNGSSLRLTEAKPDQRASAFSTTTVNPNLPWSTHFVMSMSGNQGGIGPADGIVFALQSDLITALGKVGGGLGYAGISPSFGLEFDIWHGNVGDPPAAHIGLIQNGSTSSYIECATENAIASPCDTAFNFPLYSATPTPVYGWISYDGAGTVSVYASNTPTQPATPLLQAKVDLGPLGSAAIAGFTSATGAGNALQEVLSWQLNGNPPAVTSIAPSSGPSQGGTSVKIRGTGFLPGATVTIGGAAASVDVISEEEISATTTEAPAGPDEVVVRDANGTSTLGPTYTYLPAPKVTSITPSSGPSAGGTPVKIKGTRFLPDATVTIGGAAASVKVISEEEITATTPSAPAGKEEVVVSDANGTSKLGPAYTYLARSVEFKPLASSGVLAEVSKELPPPKLALTSNLAPVSGNVQVRVPGSSTFTPITAPVQIPFGTVVNAAQGKVTVTTEGPLGGTQTMAFYQGDFKLTQGHNGVATAALTGGSFTACPALRGRGRFARASSRHAASRHLVRKLWSSGHGHYATRGSYAAGAVLGTRWLTEDLCEGTLIHVLTDRVAVTNLVTHRRVIVTAGHSYLAKAP